MIQKEENREIVLADMHGDGVHFDKRKLAKIKSKKKKEKLKSKRKRN
ncbi:MAG: hypothetical protein LAT51_11855 [Flavobacteriaceae bacterium]|nr:hypothetical protein [Flavobacteriaceae bacterium]